MGKKKVTAIIVFVGSIILFVGVMFLLATDIDFFLNKQFVNGDFKILKEEKNKIELGLSYYDKNRKEQVQTTQNIASSYRSRLHELDSNNVRIIYGKWFNQAYLSEIKSPRILILFFETALAFFLSMGVRWGWRELF
jgi:hypothetical protein